jgi:hypothetical protein
MLLEVVWLVLQQNICICSVISFTAVHLYLQCYQLCNSAFVSAVLPASQQYICICSVTSFATVHLYLQCYQLCNSAFVSAT